MDQVPLFLTVFTSQVASGIYKWCLIVPLSMSRFCSMNGFNLQGKWKLPISFQTELQVQFTTEAEGEITTEAEGESTTPLLNLLGGLASSSKI